jgi:hypothetical protein
MCKGSRLKHYDPHTQDNRTHYARKKRVWHLHNIAVCERLLSRQTKIELDKEFAKSDEPVAEITRSYYELALKLLEKHWSD